MIQGIGHAGTVQSRRDIRDGTTRRLYFLHNASYLSTKENIKISIQIFDLNVTHVRRTLCAALKWIHDMELPFTRGRR